MPRSLSPSTPPMIPTLLSGENYTEWCEKVKEHLNLKGQLHFVEQGCKRELESKRGVIGVRDRQEVLIQEKMNDIEVLFFIQKHVSEDIGKKIYNATTAKEAWDMIETMFQASNNDEAIDFDCGAYPLSGDKPFFDLFLTKSALMRPFSLTFPNRVSSLLPSTKLKATLTYKEKDYNVSFNGQGIRKRIGGGWRWFAEEHKLMEGDAMVFEVIESDETKLRLKTQILRCSKIPPELEQEINEQLVINSMIVIDDDEEEEEEESQEKTDAEDDDDNDDNDDDDDYDTDDDDDLDQEN